MESYHTSLFIMKATFFAFVLTLLFIAPLQAQNERPEYNNDLSLSFTTVQAVSSPFQSVLFNPRLMYRHHLGKFALRAQVEGMQYENRNESPIDYAYGFQKSFAAMLGGQYTVQVGRFGFYGFLDLGYGQLELSKVETLPVTLSSFSNQYELIHGLKGQTGLGVDFRFAKRWRLGVESAAIYFYGRATRTPGGVDLKMYNSIGPQIEFKPAAKWIINPINAVWLTYSFGQA